MVFLYFAQNRGWLNQDPEYLIKNFAKFKKDGDGFGYYGEFLHRLFRSLAEPSFGDRLEGIPFLNGGLFDDDEFRPLQSKLKISNETFAALFEDLLEAYNFTVREDTPLSQEVAVDPEMLGKIFESIVLHAESAGEEFQAPDKRKATGSYYTPRIVVHFNCRETLRLYFVNRAAQLADPAARATWTVRISRLFKEIEPDDGFNEEDLKILRETLTPTEAKRALETLNNLRTLDPAVGSGAFPVGLLHELVSLRRVFECVANGYHDPIKGEGSTWMQGAKEHFIKDSLFGVDIQQQAIEICRLRLWLSLLVDYELGVNPFEAERGKFLDAINHISQLPNLEMNFKRGDSLHDFICDIPVHVEVDLQRYVGDLGQIEDLGHDLHEAKRASRKRKLRLQIVSLRLGLAQKVVKDQITTLSDAAHNLASDFFNEPGLSDRQTQRRAEMEISRLKKALEKLESSEKELQRLEKRTVDGTPEFYRNLRKLEGAEPDGPHNFVWRLDFPHVLGEKKKGTLLDNFPLVNEAGQGELVEAKDKSAGGFDLIVGNPPFVTARNAEKRQLYRERWPRVCEGNYQLVSPFFELSFGLLKSNGQLGFIVSNAFARRDIGKPLVEHYFPTVHLQKVVDCSGLLFPGHGTPTCLVFGRQPESEDPNWREQPIRIAAILPGGGDLRKPPEDTLLWHTLAAQHDNPGFENAQVVVADRNRRDLDKHPWNFDSSAEETKRFLEKQCSAKLADFTKQSIGRDSSSQADDLYYMPLHSVRRSGIGADYLKPLIVGEQIRDWQIDREPFAIWPYKANAVPSLSKSLEKLLTPFKDLLEARSLFNKTTLEAGLKWFEYREYYVRGLQQQIIFPYIATHGHFTINTEPCVLNRHALVFTPLGKFETGTGCTFIGFFNSSLAVFWLKQYCFNKGAGAEEDRDRYEFSGGRVEQMPLAQHIADTLDGKPNTLIERLTALSSTCWERGCELSSLALRKLFEKSDEAYYSWNAALPGHVTPHAKLGAPFITTAELQERFAQAVSRREQLRAEMVAMQEEMDWLVYAAYSLLAADHPAAQIEVEPASLDQAHRPFRLWEAAGGDFAKAVAMIPADWPKQRRDLWEARLAAIRDNEHILRIEQPVYKRRWDEQWKVSNRWMAGPVAYAQEFVDAFRWWLAEKAEWHLEHNAKGGPIELGAWTVALWKDPRIQAAWPVVADAIHQVGQFKFDASENEDKELLGLDPGYEPFAKFLKQTVADESVPAGIPPAIPWDDLAAKKKWTPAQLKKAQSVRGKLNVPRERFRQTEDGSFLWAGKP